MFKVFYSWQSDLPNPTNRRLILTALEKACKRQKSEEGVLPEAVVDRDTVGLPGAPSINDAILSKIRDSDAFVADVSLVNAPSKREPNRLGSLRSLVDGARAIAEFARPGKSSSTRPTPNPNVLTELGYAMAQLGTEALVLVVNTHYGSMDYMPFDLRPLRKLVYRAGPHDDLAAVRRDLEGKLANAIKDIRGAVRGDPVDTILNERTKQVAGAARALFNDLVVGAAGTADRTATEALLARFEEVTADELAAVCERINPNADSPHGADLATNRRATWWECLNYHQKRSRSCSEEIMRFSPFLKREHVALLMRVDTSTYFSQLDFLRNTRVRNTSLSWLSASIWQYFQLALKLQRYGERELARRAKPM